MTFLESYEHFFGQIMYRLYKLKVGKFNADQMLFVGLADRKPQGEGGTPLIGLGLTAFFLCVFGFTNHENLYEFCIKSCILCHQ